jgi:hypothetical protein
MGVGAMRDYNLKLLLKRDAHSGQVVYYETMKRKLI